MAGSGRTTSTGSDRALNEHGLTTLRALGCMRSFWGCQRDVLLCWLSGINASFSPILGKILWEVLTPGLQFFTKCKPQEAVIPHLDEAFGQHMLEKATQESFPREGPCLVLSAFRGTILEGDLGSSQIALVIKADQATIAERYSVNIRRQILEDCMPIAHCFAVHHPFLLPHCLGNLF